MGSICNLKRTRKIPFITIMPGNLFPPVYTAVRKSIRYNVDKSWHRYLTCSTESSLIDQVFLHQGCLRYVNRSQSVKKNTKTGGSQDEVWLRVCNVYQMEWPSSPCPGKRCGGRWAGHHEAICSKIVDLHYSAFSWNKRLQLSKLPYGRQKLVTFISRLQGNDWLT